MPRALADYLRLVFYFWSNEYSGNKLEAVHVHISRGNPEANATKIWLKTDGTLKTSRTAASAPYNSTVILSYHAV
jgi:hypothetical protein